MKLALIAHHVAPIRPPFAGGVESLTHVLTRWLADRHDVVLFASEGSEVPGVEVRELELTPELSPASRADVSMPPEAFLGAHHAYQRLMLELADNADGFDLVHCHSLHYLPVAMASMLPVPTLLTLHTPPTPWLESALRARRGMFPVLSAVSTATSRLWSDVVAVHDVVPNGIDLSAWRAAPGGAGAVWCGRMVPEKAPHLAIDAARAAGMSLTLAGPISDGVYWEREVAHRLGPDVHYAGHLGHGDLAELIGRSGVALLTPQWEEPFGLAAAEAMACGTPVAAFARGGLRDLVPRVAGRLARPDSVLDLARAIREARELDRRAVRAYARSRFGLGAMGHAYEDLYARLLLEDPAPARVA